MFEKTKLSMHIGSSKRFAKKIKKLVRDLKKEFAKLEDSEESIDEAIKSRNIDNVKKVFNNFIDDCEKAEEDLIESEEDEFIIEKRLIEDYKNIKKGLLEIKKKFNEKFGQDSDKLAVKEGEEIDKDCDELLNSFKEIKRGLKKERKRAKDIKKDREKLRDKKVWGNAIIFHTMKILARHEKRDAKKEKKLDKKIDHEEEDILKLLEEKIDSKKDKKELEKELRKELKDLDKELEDFIELEKEEFKKIFKFEMYTTVISFRVQDLNEEDMKKLYALAKTGFPEETIEEIKEKENDFLKDLKEEEKQEYKYARYLMRTGRSAA